MARQPPQRLGPAERGGRPPGPPQPRAPVLRGPPRLWAGRMWGGYLSQTRTLLSIHNLAYQGLFDPGDLYRIGFRHGEESNVFLSDGAASSLKAGLLTADAIST